MKYLIKWRNLLEKAAGKDLSIKKKLKSKIRFHRTKSTLFWVERLRKTHRIER